jgi:signal transduction histidine kinase
VNRLHRHPLLFDLLLALVLLGVCVASASGGEARLFSAALILPLVWRRRAPLEIFCVVAAVAFAHWLADVNLTADIALLVAIYTVAAHEPRGRVIAACAVLEIGIVLAVVRWADQAQLPALVLLTGMATAAVVLGLNVRTRRAYLAGLEERAVQLERERDQQGRLAAAAERARIAREMHDIVAHNLSVMIALADGAGFMAEREPARSVGAMDQVSRTGRHALDEMRRLLGVLRDDETAALAPQPGLVELDALLERVRAAGLHATLETAGTPVPLGAGAELAVYRLVQEALTNTLKHAGPDARATVRLRYDADGVEVEVTDDGAGRARVAAGGQGLSGMRERAAVYGGALEAGPAPEGGWRVHARLSAAA